jgi:hypothetical protein
MDYKIMKKWLIVGISLMFFTSAFSGISQKTTNTSALPSLIKVTSEISEDSSPLQHSWQQINEDGFGDKHNVGTRAMTQFGGYLCVGVTNFNLNSSEMNGCELWCYNGKDWIQSVGNRSNASIGPGFGNKNNAECSILISFNGILYVGTANNQNGCELWRTRDPVNGTWEKVVDKGFGYASNLAMWSAEVFKGSLYIGTINCPNGCQIWRTSNGKDFEAVVGGGSHLRSGFGEYMNLYAWYMKEYDGMLYVGTQNTFGGEIWRSADGTTWECVVGLKGNYPRGFQMIDHNWGIRTLAVFKGDIYAGTAAIPSVTITLKIRGISDRSHEVKVFDSPEVGLQIWRLNASEDQKWQCTVGGFIEWNHSGNGFGDNHNIYAWTMKVFNDSLYVGTYNVKREYVSFSLKDMFTHIAKGENLVYLLGSDLVTKKGDGCQIWMTRDGTHWIQVVGNETNGPGNGFGDVNNNGIRSMSVYQTYYDSNPNDDIHWADQIRTNVLIIGTANAVTGCEIWKYQ